MIPVSSLISGLFIGSFYGLMAVGLALLFGVLNVVNFAHGDFLVLGGYITFFLFAGYGLTYVSSFFITVAVMAGIGVLVYFAVLRHAIGRGLLHSLILTFGLSFVIRDTIRDIWGAKLRSITFMTGSITFGSMSFSQSYIFTAVCSLAAFGFLWYVLSWTKWGKAMRAATQSPDVAQACGINLKKIQALAVALGICMAGVGGAFTVMNYVVYPTLGVEKFLIKAFAITILGGLGSVPGCLVGGLVLGLAESITTYYFTSQIAQFVAFAVIVVMLSIRPTGIFGVEEMV